MSAVVTGSVSLLRMFNTRRVISALTAALFVLWTTFPGLSTDTRLSAQTSPDIAGTWRGTLVAAQFDPLEIVFHILGSAGNYSATLDIPSQSRTGLTVDSVNVNGSNITLRMDAIQAEYYASLVPVDDGSAIESMNGDWGQSGEHIPLRMSRDKP